MHDRRLPDESAPMSGRYLRAEWNKRFSDPWFRVPAVFGSLAGAVLVVFVMTDFFAISNVFSAGAEQAIAFTLIFVAAVGMGFAGFWWTATVEHSYDFEHDDICSHCAYELRGHDPIPELCPECGEPPKPIAPVDVTTRRLYDEMRVQGPGIALWLLSAPFWLLTLLALITMA